MQVYSSKIVPLMILLSVLRIFMLRRDLNPMCERGGDCFSFDSGYGISLVRKNDWYGVLELGPKCVVE